MTLTPDDIVNHEFKQRVRGYDVESVDGFLDRLADQIEATDREVTDLRSRLRDAESRLAEALETESTLKRTLVTAQDAAQRALDDAREQADELRGAAEREVTDQLERARAEAERLVAEGREEHDRLVAEAREQHDRLVAEGREQRYRLIAGLEDLRAVEQRHRTQLRQHLDDTLAALDRLDTLPPRSELVAPGDDPDGPADAPDPTAAPATDPPATPADAGVGPPDAAATGSPQDTDTEAAAGAVAAEHAWAALYDGLDTAPTAPDHDDPDPAHGADAEGDDPLFGSRPPEGADPGAPPPDQDRDRADEDRDRVDEPADDDPRPADQPPPPPGSPEPDHRDLTVRVHEG